MSLSYSNFPTTFVCDCRILSPRQVIENSRQFVLLRTDILQKRVVGSPWFPAQQPFGQLNVLDHSNNHTWDKNVLKWFNIKAIWYNPHKQILYGHFCVFIISLVWMTKFASTAQGNVKIVTMDSSAVVYIYVKELTPTAKYFWFLILYPKIVFSSARQVIEI